MQEFTTPMMKQYMEIKKQYEDCLLLYRMGDFYELFLEDARIGSHVLNITLTSKAAGKNTKIPMAGVPYHAVDSYLSKLVKAGYKVAICEQVSLPSKKGIIDREVIRIVTPGTILDEKALEQKENNYIISLDIDSNALAICIADISTGYFAATQVAFSNIEQVLRDELAKIHPSECILSSELYNNSEILGILKSEKGLNLYCFQQWDKYSQNAKKHLKNHFGVTTLSSFGIEDKQLILQAAAALLGYLETTQKATIAHIKKLLLIENTLYVQLDKSTIINLELFSTLRDHDIKGSLISVLDQTLTSMGGRLLKQWIQKPLINEREIEARYNAIEECMKNIAEEKRIRSLLKEVTDIERIISRLSVNIGNARDIINLKESLKKIILVKEELSSMSSSLLVFCNENITKDISEIITLIESTIIDEPLIGLHEGGIIQSGVNKKLDTLKKIIYGSKDWILGLERQERQRTGINSLKIRFNKVFGFYIEITKANLHLIPKNYIRKQTLVNGERFITPELKTQEEIILSAEEEINTLEYRLFIDVLNNVLKNISSLQHAAESIAIIDCITNFSYIAFINRYTRPKLIYSGEILLKESRHPVVEKLLEEKEFVPNNVALNNSNQQLLLITGPNMAGKSVFIRQVALIVLMAQIGCYVPAKSAHISLTDKIFVRSGASDIITSGLSTFMVEMVETAHILHNATKNSLIIMDEIGRGTSTYDGINIAWAVAQYLVSNPKNSPKTLFATHYHELQALENEYPLQIKNFHMEVDSTKGYPIFLHTILPGGASHSFGVAVAKLAGIPQVVIEKAMEVLQLLETRDTRSTKQPASSEQKVVLKSIIEHELEMLDIHQLTPLDALNILSELKNKLKTMQLDNENFINSQN